MVSVDDVRRVAAGRWPEILSALGGIAPELLDGRHHPCPRPGCGGVDRFRAFTDGKGGAYCNACLTSNNGDGFAVLQWITGKTFPEVVRDVAEYLNMQPSPQATRPKPKQPADDRPVFATADDALAAYRLGDPSTTWTYHDQAGKPIGMVGRWDKSDGTKDIRPVSLNCTGWKMGGMSEPRPLYNLHRIPRTGRVYVTEGEKCADAVRSMGLSATTSPSGSRSAHKADWTPLAGLEVVILPDNDPPGEEFAGAVIKQLAELSPRPTVKILRLPGLPAAGDVVDYLDARDAVDLDTIRAEIESMADALPIEGATQETGLIFRTAGELVRMFPTLRPYVVDQLLRVGETMNIISAPKFGKSWLVLGLVLCVACGLKWLGKFWTRRGRVLLIDNELHPETLASRLPRVAESMGLNPEDYQDSVVVVNLRGQLIDLQRLAVELMRLEQGAFDLIVLDAWYRLQPSGSDENSNGDVMQLYNLLDSVADRIGAAFVCVHHSSKGNQSGKAVTDVGSGAGAQSRAPDVHMVLRPHETEGAVVVDAAIRSSAPLDPFCLRWDFPHWTLADDLDPKELRQDRPKKKTQDDRGPSPQEIHEQKEQAARDKLLKAYRTFPGGETANVVRGAAGMSGAVFGPINAELIRRGIVQSCKVKKNWCEFDGFKLVESGRSDNSDNPDKNTTCPTEGGVHGRTSSPPLGGAVLSDLSHPSDTPAVRGGHADRTLSDREVDAVASYAT